MNTWTMKNGKVIKISEMATSHLKNTIALIKRRLPELRLYAEAEVCNYIGGFGDFCLGGGGEEAAACAEMEESLALSSQFETYSEALKVMEKEWKKRKSSKVSSKVSSKPVTLNRQGWAKAKWENLNHG